MNDMVNPQLSNIIGATAAILTTTAFLPQVWHSYKTRDLSGISLPMYSIFSAGVALWLVYGLLKQDMPLIASNSVTLLAALSILVLKIRD